MVGYIDYKRKLTGTRKTKAETLEERAVTLKRERAGAKFGKGDIVKLDPVYEQRTKPWDTGVFEGYFPNGTASVTTHPKGRRTKVEKHNIVLVRRKN